MPSPSPLPFQGGRGERSSSFSVQARHKDRALQYFFRRATDYRQHVERGPLKLLRHRERSAVLELAGFRPEQRMLDVGCGPGFYALEAKRRGLKVSAVDALPSMVAPLVGRVDEVLVGDIEHWRVRTQFDCVVCAGVLDFVLDPRRAFDNLCRLVAPGGRLVLLVPRAGPGGWIYRLDKLRWGVRVNFFEVSWFERMAEGTPLAVRRWVHPLPFNTALLLEHRAAPGGRAAAHFASCYKAAEQQAANGHPRRSDETSVSQGSESVDGRGLDVCRCPIGAGV